MRTHAREAIDWPASTSCCIDFQCITRHPWRACARPGSCDQRKLKAQASARQLITLPEDARHTCCWKKALIINGCARGRARALGAHLRMCCCCTIPYLPEAILPGASDRTCTPKVVLQQLLYRWQQRAVACLIIKHQGQQSLLSTRIAHALMPEYKAAAADAAAKDGAYRSSSSSRDGAYFRSSSGRNPATAEESGELGRASPGRGAIGGCGPLRGLGHHVFSARRRGTGGGLPRHPEPGHRRRGFCVHA